jgi:hypothetical protein
MKASLHRGTTSSVQEGFAFVSSGGGLEWLAAKQGGKSGTLRPAAEPWHEASRFADLSERRLVSANTSKSPDRNRYRKLESRAGSNRASRAWGQWSCQVHEGWAAPIQAF